MGNADHVYGDDVVSAECWCLHSGQYGLRHRTGGIRIDSKKTLYPRKRRVLKLGVSDEATASAISAGNEFLNGIFGALGLSIDIQHRVDGDRIVYEVFGDTELLKRRPNLVTAVTL